MTRFRADMNKRLGLAKALAYARSHGGPDVTLAKGTQPFTGSLIG